MSEYDDFRIANVLDGVANYLGVQCTSCEAVVWEPLGAGHQLRDITDACREHMCDDVLVVEL